MDSFYTVRCTICQGEVRLSSARPLTDEQVKELMARMKCHTCLKAELTAKK